MSVQYKILIMFCLSVFSVAAFSGPQTGKDRIIVTRCMSQALKDKGQVIAQTTKFSLLAITLDDEVITTLRKNRSTCGKFLNLDVYYQHHTLGKHAARQLLTTSSAKRPFYAPLSLKIRHDKQVMALFQVIEPDKIWHSNQHLTSYINRSASTRTGVEAAHWFKQQFDTMARESGREDVTSYLVNTGKRYKQPSVVTLIGKNKSSEAIVIGAHIDTLSGNMPGADDDSSGISVGLEIARVLLSSEIILDHPVYIIAYAAEEQGLVGSGYVVQSFIDKKTPVKAVMQLDQAGYRANPQDPTIWLLKDYVDPQLTQFVAELLTHYVKIPVAYTECGYACSDHVNWSRRGISACYPSATTLDDDNPYIHSAEDKLEIINLDHMVNFTKLGLAFITELGLD